MVQPDQSLDGVTNFVLGAIKNSFQELNTSNMATITAISEDKTKLDVTIDSTKEDVPDVPFFTLQGGGNFLQFPVKVGDKCLVVFAKSTVEDWLGGNDEFIFDNNFDINNGFALVGINTNASPIELQDYTDFKVETIKIRNENEELITVLSDTAQLISDTNDEISKITVTVTSGSSAGTYPIDQIAIFAQLKADMDAIKARLDTFKE